MTAICARSSGSRHNPMDRLNPAMPVPRIVFLDRDSLPWPGTPSSLPHQWEGIPEHRHRAALEPLQRRTDRHFQQRSRWSASCSIRLTGTQADRGFGHRRQPDRRRRLPRTRHCRVQYPQLCRLTIAFAEHTLMLMLALRRKLLDYQRSVAGRRGGSAADQFCLMQHPIQDLAGRRSASSAKVRWAKRSTPGTRLRHARTVRRTQTGPAVAQRLHTVRRSVAKRRRAVAALPCSPKQPAS